jgi:hypothetical protein
VQAAATRRTDVLGETRQDMPFQADAIYCGLHGAVEQFNNEHQQHRRDQQRPFDPRTAQPQAQGYDQDTQTQFLAKRGLLAIGAAQAFAARCSGPDDARQAGRLLADRRFRNGHALPTVILPSC